MCIINNRTMPYIVYHQSLNSSLTTTSADSEEYSGTILWFVINILLILVTVLGNLLTISAILSTRKLNSIIANQFIFSLAVSDLLVGLTIPYHMAFYVVPDFGSGKINCLLRFVLISFACSSSIMNLLMIAADRYVAIVYPLHYNRLITRKTSIFSSVFVWGLSFAVSAIPLSWNEWEPGKQCEIFEVIPNSYMNMVLFPMFLLIWLMMLLLYSRICREAAGQAKRMRVATTMQNISGLRDSKSFQVMLTILGCFTVCWLPYFIIALYNRFHANLKSGYSYEVAFNLAVANSSMNPIIYAWKNHNFRQSFLHLIRCRSPNQQACAQFVTNHVPSKKSSISNGVGNAACDVDDGESDSGKRADLEMGVADCCNGGSNVTNGGGRIDRE
ncbi:probable G-protein coupled receptor No18 [Anthonomus grandis grandis]|uniref:probable G-protein coupled receptor No18 n=1 Tax=Anthonomus grandis grandis TaxID=2921223 RepID=UPI002164F717|nr:probable G-protein coupled receptor No18 [Anthonomus grandis grandis]